MDITTSPSLLERLRIEGNERDWEVFFSLYARPIHGLAMQFGLPPDQAEDVVQEAMIAIMRRMPEFIHDAGRARFRTWLWRVVKNITITHWRRAQRRPTVRLEGEHSGANLLETLAADEPGGADSLERSWRLALVREGLRLLEADTHVHSRTLAIFRDLVLEGHDSAAVAERYGVRRNGVDVIRTRLTQRLAKIVAALESGELKPLTEPESEPESPEPELS